MTTNQLRALELQHSKNELAETQRANLVREKEAERHNRDQELVSKIKLGTDLVGSALGSIGGGLIKRSGTVKAARIKAERRTK